MLLLLYPILFFFLLVSGRPLLEFAGIASLAVLILLPALTAGRWLAWPALIGAIALAGYGAYSGHAALMAYLPQILIGSLLALMFGRTLRPGSVPLITRIAIAIRGSAATVPLTYTRGVTILWVLIFLLLVLEGIVFVLIAPPWPVSQVNLVTYSVIVVVVVGEYVFHNIRYPHPSHRGFPDFVRHLVQVDYRRLLGD